MSLIFLQGPAGLGLAWQGRARLFPDWRGSVGPGMAWLGSEPGHVAKLPTYFYVDWRGGAWTGPAVPGSVRIGMEPGHVEKLPTIFIGAWHGWAGHGRAWFGAAGPGMAQLGTWARYKKALTFYAARLGDAGRGQAWLCKAIWAHR